MEGQLSPALCELYYLYGSAMIGVAKQQSVDFLSAMVQRKMREKSGDPIIDEENDLSSTYTKSSSGSLCAVPLMTSGFV